jgi:hypothetical protein
MQAGDRVKTMNYSLEYWWPSEGENRDRKLGNDVGAWVAQNQKVLDKKRATSVVQLIQEQFPYLTAIDARHVQLQWARVP